MTRTAHPITLDNGVKLTDPRISTGAAGAVAASVTVTYPGEDPTRVTFHGSRYGGPVVAEHPRIGQTFVTDPERFGTFHVDPPRWVRRYFGA